MEADKELEKAFSSEASTATAEAKDLFQEMLSRQAQLDDSFEDLQPGSSEECSLEELTEWATLENLGPKFQSGLVEIIKLGGLRQVNAEFLAEKLNIRLPQLQKKIFEAIKRKLSGKKKVRFGEVVKFEPILTKKPKYTKCAWVDAQEMEDRHEQATLQAAMRTWRFCATGLDGLEEESLTQDVFEAWKPKPKGIFDMFQDFLDGVGAFFVSMPCCCREKPLE